MRAEADRFGVGVASAVRWSQRFRATGSAAAKPQGQPRGGKKAYVVAGQRERLLAQIAGSLNLTLRAMVEPADGTRLQVIKFLSFFLV